MSEQTYEAFEQALKAHIADEAEGAFTTGYVVLVSNASADEFDRGETAYTVMVPFTQAAHVGLGLAHMLVDLINTDED